MIFNGDLRMTKTPAILLSYLDEIGGTGSDLAPDPAAAKSLPVFVGRIYEPYRGQVFGRDYVLLLCTAKNQPTPGQVEKHAEIARSALGPNVAFVFPALPPFDRKRLIQRRIPFIVPGRQTYLPMVMIDLREKSPTRPAIGGQSAGSPVGPGASAFALSSPEKARFRRLATQPVGRRPRVFPHDPQPGLSGTARRGPLPSRAGKGGRS